jgi:hypothetical protein
MIDQQHRAAAVRARLAAAVEEVLGRAVEAELAGLGLIDRGLVSGVEACGERQRNNSEKSELEHSGAPWNLKPGPYTIQVVR